MENVMGVLFVIYVILGFIIYHSIFDIWYFNFGKAIIGEIIGACLFAALMTGVTLIFWYVAAIIIVVLGIGFSAKCSNPSIKKIIVIIFIIAAVFVSIAGINYNKQRKQEKEAAGKEELLTANCLPENGPVEWEDYVIAGRTYVKKQDNSVAYMNALLDRNEEENKVGRFSYILTFIKVENNKVPKIEVEERFTSDKKDVLTMICNVDDSCKFTLNGNNESIEITMPSEEKEYSGTYILAKESDEEEFYKALVKSGFVEDEEDYEYDNGTDDDDEYEDNESDDYDEDDYEEDYEEDYSVDDSEMEEDQGLLYTVTVTASDGYVNIREEQSTDSQIKDTADTGEVLKVYMDEGKWLYIEHGNIMGWVAASQVSKNADDSNTSSEYILPNSQTELISAGDLEGLTKEQCRIARNEIYARHGKIFESADLQEYFGSTSWYMTDEGFDESFLTQIEKDNIDTIVEYEKSQGYR